MVPQDLQQAYLALYKAMENLNIARQQNPSAISLYEQSVQKGQMVYNQLLQKYNMPPGTDIGPMLQQQMNANAFQPMNNNMGNFGYNNFNQFNGGNMNPNMLYNNNQFNTQQQQTMSNNMANTSMVGSRYSSNSNTTNTVDNNVNNLLNNVPTTNKQTTKPVVESTNSNLLNVLSKSTEIKYDFDLDVLLVLSNISNHEEVLSLLTDLTKPECDFIGILKRLSKVNNNVFTKVDMLLNKRIKSLLKYCYNLDMSLETFTSDYHELLSYVERNKEKYYDLSIEIKNIIPEFLSTITIEEYADEDETGIAIKSMMVNIDLTECENEVKDEIINWANKYSYTTFKVDNVLATSSFISKLDKLFDNSGVRSKTYHKPFKNIIKLKIKFLNDILKTEIFISSKLDYITNLTISKELFKIY